MKTEDNLNHDFLNLQPVQAPKRTFLGDMGTSARLKIFILTGLVSFSIFTALVLISENRLFVASDKALEADLVTELATQLELRIANVRSAEKAYLISKNRTFAKEFHDQLVSVSKALNQLSQMQVIQSQQKHLDTIRDGLAQYDEEFSKILSINNTNGLESGKNFNRDSQSIIRQASQFDDLLSYLSLPTSAISLFSEELQVARRENLDSARLVFRIIIISGGFLIFVLITFVGSIAIRSFSLPLNQLASTVSQLAKINKIDSLLTRRSSGPVGDIALALDHWQITLTDLFQVRQELLETKDLLEKPYSKAEASGLIPEGLLSKTNMSEEMKGSIPNKAPIKSTEPDIITSVSDGALSSARQELTNFSQYVNASANDVERTGALIKGLDNTTQQMEELIKLVVSIRDQTNLLSLRLGPQSSNSDKLGFLSNEEKIVMADASGITDLDTAQCIDVIRISTEQAEKISLYLRQEMADVTRLAREIAITASEQAIEATTKLLNQSERLQNLLGKLISKVEPSKVVDDINDTKTKEE